MKIENPVGLLRLALSRLIEKHNRSSVFFSLHHQAVQQEAELKEGKLSPFWNSLEYKSEVIRDLMRKSQSLHVSADCLFCIA